MTVRSLTQTGASNSLLRGKHASPAYWTPTCRKVSSTLLVRIFFSVVDTNTGDGPKFMSALCFFPHLCAVWDSLSCRSHARAPFIWDLCLTHSSHTEIFTLNLHSILSDFFFKEKIYSIECCTQDPVTVRFEPDSFLWLENAWLSFISVQANSLEHPKLCTLPPSLWMRRHVWYIKRN